MTNVILLKSNDCHFCHDFNPVFRKASKLNKDSKLHFYEFNVNNENDKSYLRKHYAQLDVDNIEGVPAVYVNSGEHTQEITTVFPTLDEFPSKIYDDLTPNALLKLASKRFLKNVKNANKSIHSASYKTYLGGTDIQYKIAKYETRLRNKGIAFNAGHLTGYKKYIYLKKKYMN